MDPTARCVAATKPHDSLPTVARVRAVTALLGRLAMMAGSRS